MMGSIVRWGCGLSGLSLANAGEAQAAPASSKRWVALIVAMKLQLFCVTLAPLRR